MEKKEELRRIFEKAYGIAFDGDSAKVYFAPGRVNLIGEHTDYNGGHVFPCALTMGTYAAVRPNTIGKMRLYSENFSRIGIREVSCTELVYDAADNWCNYPKGVMWALKEEGYTIPCGLDIAFYGNIPNGSGLSSSASIEVLTAAILLDQFGWEMDWVRVSLLAQKAECQFIGVNCGIMDQFSSAMGREGHAIYLDTSSLEYSYVPLQLNDCCLIITSSNKKRGLADSKYNERHAQCEEALAGLQNVCSASALCDLTPAQFEEYKDSIEREVCLRRARHIIYENERTMQAVEALTAGDLEAFGLLMNASHVSLRDDYEVTGVELDTLVEAAWQQEGVLGSRMTGAGFGGCTVSLVRRTAVDAFIQNVGRIYKEKIGYAADFYVVAVGSGPCVLE